ncbi:hypothetical protein HDU93_002513 [Gonapodya sp. JEL0774]|nr:hypothetical protein HDU93_002513 [Gonapodya sp. JEL0774]
MYTVGSELLGDTSSTTVFRELLERVKEHERVGELVGTPIRGTVDQSSRARTVKTVNHHIVQDPVTGQQKMIVRFYIQGAKSTGTVNGEMVLDPSGVHWTPFYLYVDVPGQGLPSERVVVEDHRPAPPTKDERSRRRGLFSFDSSPSSPPVRVPLTKPPSATTSATQPPEPDPLTRITNAATSARDFIVGQFAGQPLPPPPPELVDAAKQVAETAKGGWTEAAQNVTDWVRSVTGQEVVKEAEVVESPPPVPHERTWFEWLGISEQPVVTPKESNRTERGEVGGVWRWITGSISGKRS